MAKQTKKQPMAEKALVDCTLGEVQQIAKDLGVVGWDMEDRTYLVKCIKAMRIANARANAQAVADEAMDEATKNAAHAAEAAPKVDFSDPTAPKEEAPKAAAKSAAAAGGGK